MPIRKQVSLHGKRAYVTQNDQVGARNGFVAGGLDKPGIVLPGSPDTVAIFDDFLGQATRPIAAGTDMYWLPVDGDSGGTAAVGVVAGTSGILRLNLGATPVDQVKMGINQALSWKANQGPSAKPTDQGLRLACRLKTAGWHDTGNSTLNVWVGFTDSVDGSEVPVHDTGGAIVSVATDAVGIAFGSRATGGDTGWVGYAVKTDVDAAPVVLDTGVTAGEYDVLEVEVLNDKAYFWVNGRKSGSIDSPVAAGVALTPAILAWGDTGGGVTVDVDWVNVSAPRDTGV